MSALADYVDAMWLLMQEQVDTINIRLKTLEDKDAVSVAYAPPLTILVNAPTSLDSTEWRWITDGRFGSETGGNGTGVLAYYRPETNEWISIDSGVAVTV